ncbi:MAG: glycosyltransferase [Candidatus Tenebribacter burtonii]|nr:glycosyltransferase [Candidatus Tenebribacter burtonii]
MKKISVLVWNEFTHDKRVKNISRSFSEYGYDVTVIAAKPYKGLLISENGKVKIKRIPLFSSLYSKPKNIFSESKIREKMQRESIFRFIKNNKIRLYITAFLNWLSFNLGLFFVGIYTKPDIVYANDLDTLTVGYLISKICRAKLIFDSHEIWFFGYRYIHSSKFHQLIWRILQKILITKTDATIVTTDTRAEYIKKEYNLKKVHTIRNCSRFQEVHPSTLLRDEFKIAENKLILIYHGAIHEARGIYNIVDAVREIDDIAVVFMGKGAGLLDLRDYIIQNQLEEKIFIKDAVLPDQVLKYVASADIGIQLFHYTFNHYTVISNKLFECIMAGIALISNDFPEMKKIIQEDKIGEIVDYKDLTKVKEIIMKLAKNRKLLELYKANSRKVRKKHSWGNEEKKIIKIVESL